MPIYLALSATCYDAELSAEQILASIKNVIPPSSMSPTADGEGGIATSPEATEALEKAAQEVARARGGELHNISALTGGMVAQEMIKIITKQYIPIDNTCIFDGIGSRCQVLKL